MQKTPQSTTISVLPRDWALAFCLLIAVVSLEFLHQTPGATGIYHDDGVYLTTARALAKGEGYRLTNIPGAPLQTKYPPLYSLALAAVWIWDSEFPANLSTIFAINNLFAGLAFAGLYLLAVRFAYAGRPSAFLAALLAGTSGWVVYYHSLLMSEGFFLLCIVAATWGFEAHARKESSDWPRRFAMGVLWGMPFLARSVGITFLLAALWQRKQSGRTILVETLGGLCTSLPWLVVILNARQSESGVVSYQLDYLGWFESYGASDLLTTLSANAYELSWSLIVFVFDGLTDIATPLIPANIEINLALLGLLVWAIILRRLCQGQLYCKFLALYLSLILIWPWPVFRFLVPVLFFLIIPLTKGINLSAPSPTLRRASFATISVLVLSLVLNAWMVTRNINRIQELEFPAAPSVRQRVAWQSYTKLFDWINSHIPSGAVLAAPFDSMLHLYTDRSAVRLYLLNSRSAYYNADEPVVGTVAELAERLRRFNVEFLVLTPLPSYTEEHAVVRLVDKYVQQNSDSVKLIYRGNDPRFMIFALTDGGDRW